MDANPYPFKLLPNGAKSWLSLNSIYLWGFSSETPLSKYNGMLGKDVYCYQILREAILSTFPKVRYQSENPINYLNRQLLGHNKLNKKKAEALLWDTGERLAALMGAAIHSPADIRDKNPSVPKTDWDYWQSIKSIGLAGGCVKGAMGKILVSSIEKNLKSIPVNLPDFFTVDKKTTPSLLGCALGIKEEVRHCLVFDFGHSYVKRALASFEGQKLIKIQELKPIRTRNPGEGGNQGQEILDFMAGLIADTYGETKKKGIKADPVLRFCMANNIINGSVSDRGHYGPLVTFNDNFYGILSDSIFSRTKTRFQLSVLNDAEAVAALYAHKKNAVLITLGTHIGASYPNKSNTIYKKDCTGS